MEDGKRVPVTVSREISSTLEYLIMAHGLRQVVPMFDTAGLTKDGGSEWQYARLLLEKVNIPYSYAYPTIDSVAAAHGNWYRFEGKTEHLTITGYDEYLLIPDGSRPADRSRKGLHLRYNEAEGMSLFRDNERLSPVIKPDTVLNRLIANYGMNDEAVRTADLTQDVKGEGCTIRIVYSHLRGYGKEPANLQWGGVV
ncbi:MAG: hypothetical protein EOP49_22820, partial [Sphingobacteriales bacterium]